MRRVSYFSAPITRCLVPSRAMSLDEVVSLIKSNELQSVTEQIRSLGDVNAVRRAKVELLPGITPSGTFRMRRSDGLLSSSGMVSLDIDHREDAEALKVQLAGDKDVAPILIYTSVSGKGLKVLYPIELDEKHDYRWWLEHYSRYLAARYGVIVDKSCKDICRLAFLCHDASLYYNPSAMLSVGYDRGTMESAQSPSSPLSEEARVEALCSAVERAKADIFPDYGRWLQGCFACTELGNRGLEYFHRLAQYSPKNNYEADVKQFHECQKSSRHEVSIGTVFYLASEAGVRLDCVRNDVPVGNTVNPPKPPKPQMPSEVAEEHPEDDIYISSHLAENQLPDFLNEALRIVEPDKKAVRDMLLLANLTAISYALPNFRVYHGKPRKEYSSNLMTMILARAASGKGIMNWVRTLLNPIHWQLRDQYKSDEQAYRAAIASGASQAEKPKRQMVFIPVNSSMPVFLQQLNDNGGRGLAMATEMDSMSLTLGQDYGDYSETLRCAFEHEAISQRRRRDDEYFEIESPQLSVLLSGTMNQLQPFIKSRTNGLTSRFACYIVRDKQGFDESVFDSDEDVCEPSAAFEHYKALSSRLKALYLWQTTGGNAGRTCRLVFTDVQRAWLKRVFSGQYKAYMSQLGDQYDPTVKRMAVIVKRIGLILNALRMEPEGELPEKIVCSDADFCTMLLFANKLMLHAGLMFQLLPAEAEKSIVIGSTLQQQQFFCSVPDQFSKQDAAELAGVLGIPLRTLEHWLNKGVISNQLTRLSHGEYRKNAV